MNPASMYSTASLRIGGPPINFSLGVGRPPPHSQQAQPLPPVNSPPQNSQQQQQQQQQPPQQISKPKKIRKLFSAEEDQLLSRIMYEQPFTTWIAVASQIPGRSARQCRDRWANYLSPENKNGPWSQDEDKLLADKFGEYGPQWTTIAKFFDGRSENNVKNRWYTHLKNKYNNNNNNNSNNNNSGNGGPTAAAATATTMIGASSLNPSNNSKNAQSLVTSIINLSSNNNINNNINNVTTIMATALAVKKETKPVTQTAPPPSVYSIALSSNNFSNNNDNNNINYFNNNNNINNFNNINNINNSINNINNFNSFNNNNNPLSVPNLNLNYNFMSNNNLCGNISSLMAPSLLNPIAPVAKPAHTLLPPISTLEMEISRPRVQSTIPAALQSMKLRSASAQPFTSYSHFN